MFVNENALLMGDEPEPKVVKKNTMWTHVFDAVQNWPRHKQQHSQIIELEELKEVDEQIQMKRLGTQQQSIMKSNPKIEKVTAKDEQKVPKYLKINDELENLILQDSLS